MPTTTDQNSQQRGADVAKDLVVDMVKTMTKLTIVAEALSQRIEDQTSAIDDHRRALKDAVESIKEVTDSFEEVGGSVEEVGNMIGAFFEASEKLYDLADENEEEVRFSDFGGILKKMKKEYESDDSDD